jgi:hypothetical protein
MEQNGVSLMTWIIITAAITQECGSLKALYRLKELGDSDLKVSNDGA